MGCGRLWSGVCGRVEEGAHGPQSMENGGPECRGGNNTLSLVCPAWGRCVSPEGLSMPHAPGSSPAGRLPTSLPTSLRKKTPRPREEARLRSPASSRQDRSWAPAALLDF